MQQVFQVDSPYAGLLPIDEVDVLFEVNPWVILSDISALQFHGLTDSNPTSIHVIHGRALRSELLPLGTIHDDWIDVPFPERRTPAKLLGRRIVSRTTSPNRFFGLGEYQHHGVTIRVTTPERTLVDGLLLPDPSGGILSVLTAWRRAKPLLNPEALVQFTDLYGIAVLRQRVGYLMESFG
ncbi:MAG: type IV toxin-antitoxin system AbiEi family antitoxin, partial [Chloroflexota bacterium]|nr:type IV toxin-antitoxin system AbiEi family antitoxin [Chloroflexota bacterium]